MTGTAPRALALTPKAWDLLARTPEPTKGDCSYCGQLAYIWDGKVACIDRSGKVGKACPGNGKPPRRAET